MINWRIMNDLRLRGVKFYNFKSLENTKFEIKENITGIYGENGIGKTSVIEAIELLKQDFEFRPSEINEEKDEKSKEKDPYEYIEKKYYNYLTKGKDEIKLEFDFQVENNLYTYSKQLNFKDEKYEKSVEKVSYCHIKRKDVNHEVFSRTLDSEDSQTLFEYDLFGDTKELKLTDIDRGYLRRLSSTFSVMPSIINDTISAQKISKTRTNHLNSIKCFIDTILKSSIVKLNDQSLYTMGIIPLNVHLADEKREIHGKVPLRQFNYYYQEQDIQTIEDTFNSINKIFSAILSGRKLELSIYDTRISKNTNSLEQSIEINVKQPNGAYVNIKQESTGVVKLLAILSALVELMRNESYLLAIDELDSHVYEYLLAIIINELNADIKGTLIFTSHNLTLFESLEASNISIIQRNPETLKVDFAFLKKANQKTNLRNLYIRSLYLGDDDIYETNINENKLNTALRRAARKGKNV